MSAAAIYLEALDEAADELIALGAVEDLRAYLEKRLAALPRPTEPARPVPPALVVQRALDALLAEWPDMPREAIVYGLVRALQTYISAAFGAGAVARAEQAGGVLVAGVRRRVDEAAPTEPVH